MDVSKLHQNNCGTEKEYQQVQKNMQSNGPETIKAPSECTKSKELKMGEYQVTDSESCDNVNKQCENKSVDEVNCNGLVTSEEELPMCSSGNNYRTNCENTLAADRSESQFIYDVSASADDSDEDDEDGYSMRIDDELKKAIENNLIKEIGSAFNINSSIRICNEMLNKDNEKSVSVSANKQQCATLTSCNSVKTNVECENKITIHGLGSNNTFSKHLCSDKQDNVNIHNIEIKKTVPKSTVHSTRNSQVCDVSKLVSKTSHFRNKQDNFEENRFYDKNDSTVLISKTTSFESNEKMCIRDSCYILLALE